MGDEIFAFHDTHRITNVHTEGINDRLGVLKRVAYNFVNVSNLAARALLLTPAWQHHHDQKLEGAPTSTRRSNFVAAIPIGIFNGLGLWEPFRGSSR